MFNALLLQQWYGLSDSALEEALNDRVSFRRFLGLNLDADAPDHTTLCRFRNRMAAARLITRLFAEFNRQIEGRGLVLKQGRWWMPRGWSPARARAGQEADAVDPDAGFAKQEGKPGSTWLQSSCRR